MGTDPLVLAIFNDDVALAKELLEDRNNVHSREGRLMKLAVEKGNLDMVQLLLRAGIDVNIRIDYESPVDGRIEAGFTPLFYAITSPKILDFLLKRGAEVNARDESGMTTLMHASQWTFDDAISAVRTLIRHGADIDVEAPIGKRGKNMRAVDIARRNMKKLKAAQSRYPLESFHNEVEAAEMMVDLLSDVPAA
jgi:ankyrin repeat protein